MPRIMRRSVGSLCKRKSAGDSEHRAARLQRKVPQLCRLVRAAGRRRAAERRPTAAARLLQENAH